MFLQNLNCLMQFHNHMKDSRKNIDSNLFHCNELLLHDLDLELSVVKFPSDPHCSPVSTLETGRCLSISTRILIFNFLGHTIHSLDVRVLYRAVLLPLCCLIYLCPLTALVPAGTAAPHSATAASHTLHTAHCTLLAGLYILY